MHLGCSLSCARVHKRSDILWCSLPRNDLADLLSSAVEVFVVEDVQLLFFASDHLLGDVRVGTLQAQDHGL